MWRIARLYLALLSVIAALGPVGAATAEAGPTVAGVRVGVHPGMTRFVLDLSEKVEFRVFTLADPYRVVIDLPELAWQPPREAAPSGLIKGYRSGLFAPGAWRVVLDMAGPAAVKQARLVEPREGFGYRLVLDLAPTSRDAFLAQLGSATPAPAPPAGAKPPPAAPEKHLVVIDPGHGGVDPGARGRSGIDEKHLTLAMANELRRQLEASGRYRVLLTRDRDVFLRLRERIAFAREAGADLFISLHADSIDDRRVRGLSVYTLSETASDQEAALLAADANRGDVIAGLDLADQSPDVADILIDLAQRETMNLSANFAQFTVRELSRQAKLLGRSHRSAGFAVLKAPDVPSVLVELGYLSHPEEERQLRQPAYRAKLAKALVKSIDRYFGWKDGLTKS